MEGRGRERKEEKKRQREIKRDGVLGRVRQ